MLEVFTAAKWRRGRVRASQPWHPLPGALTDRIVEWWSIARNPVWLCLGSLALACVMYAPLFWHFRDAVPAMSAIDGMLQAWQLAWPGYALRNWPWHLFQTNVFWGLPDNLAFTDVLLGYFPLSFVGNGPEAAVVRFNVAFLIAHAVAFVGAYGLARTLGLNRQAAALVGAAFAFNPWRTSQGTHLHVISSGALPLSLALLIRGLRYRRPWTALAGWLVATWQVSLGFTLGLQLLYLISFLAPGVAVAWWCRGRPPVGRALVLANLVGAGVLLAWTGFQAQQFLEVAANFPEARRTEAEVRFFSAPARGFLAASGESLAWGPVTEERRAALQWPQEDALFPGLTTILLASVCVCTPVFSWRMRLGIALGVLVTGILALGFGSVLSRWAYGFVYHYAPGWQAIRVPGRLLTLTTLGLGLLAGGGLQWLAELVNRACSPRTGVGRAVAGLLLVAVLIEGVRIPSFAPVAPLRDGQLAFVGPQLHLPSGPYWDAAYMYWSTDGFPALFNGYAGFQPLSLFRLRNATLSFPDDQSVAALRAARVRTVVLHQDWVAHTPWSLAATRSVEGLGITRVETQGVIAYDLFPDRARGLQPDAGRAAAGHRPSRS
jgi:hypothetical protein